MAASTQQKHFDSVYILLLALQLNQDLSALLKQLLLRLQASQKLVTPSNCVVVAVTREDAACMRAACCKPKTQIRDKTSDQN